MQAIDIVDNTDVIANPELKTIAAAMKEDDNQVIVIAKLKSSLIETEDGKIIIRNLAY